MPSQSGCSENHSSAKPLLNKSFLQFQSYFFLTVFLCASAPPCLEKEEEYSINMVFLTLPE